MRYKLEYLPLKDESSYIFAIKTIRQEFHIGLKEAKELVDLCRSGNGIVYFDYPSGDVSQGIQENHYGEPVLRITLVKQNHFSDELFEI
jgi:hypothetical protein